ncbi:oocyte zinc finger protein XlCOF7.1-like [Mixophyes fleayi]|uniref:oocyte zinc finger protein XlCOF7.1-like n=1 Tax=Mixophyes fleayi TaxID=3061075 RepID=UPI003F4DA6D9
MLEHIASSVMKMSNTKEQISEKILNHALEIIYLLTGEKYVIVKKKSPHCCSHTQSGAVPVKCDDIAVYFSMEEWDYIKGHKQQYQDVIMETDSVSNTMEISKHLDLELPDLHNQDLDCVSIDGKLQYEMGKDKHELKDNNLETSAAMSAAETTKLNTMGERHTATPLLHGAIKVEIPDEIPEDHMLGGLTNNTSILGKVSSPLYRWDQNIWSISERIVCGSSNRSYSRPAMKPPGGGLYSQQSSFPALNPTPIEEKPFRCIACGQLFKYKSSATRHYTVIHGVKPHQCNECGRRFSTKFKFVVHKCNPSKNLRRCWDDQTNIVLHDPSDSFNVLNNQDPPTCDIKPF